MSADQVERRLAVILAANVAGYSRPVGADEEATLKTLTLYRTVMTGLIEEHQGRIMGIAGDNLMAAFGSAVQAVRSAVAIQRALDRRNADLDETHRMTFRVGIHLGDVRVQGTDLLGDGVNIAARLEQMAEQLNSNIAEVRSNRSFWELHTGRSQQALHSLDLAMKLNPLPPGRSSTLDLEPCCKVSDAWDF